VALRELRLGEQALPGVEVAVSRPALACMAAQYAGWAVDVPLPRGGGKYFAMGSGPARALYGGEALFEEIDYADSAEVAVLTLESAQLPPDEVARWLAGKCAVEVGNVHLLVARTASLVGSVQIAARIVETGLHKMHELGFDIECVLSGFGTCPLAPVAADDLTAIGRTNDAVLYGGRAWYTVDCDDALLRELVPRLPSSASADYGASFGELFRKYDGDFYKIDPLLFSPAEVAVTNARTGRTYRAGNVDPAMIAEALLA
jgi:methenyltetrahydromethanopterin cyclohydrolase